MTVPTKRPASSARPHVMASKDVRTKARLGMSESWLPATSSVGIPNEHMAKLATLHMDIGWSGQGLQKL